MILSEICKHRGLEPHIPQPPLLQSLRGHLHNHILAAGVRHLSQQREKLVRLGSGSLGVKLHVAYLVAAGAYKPGLVSERHKRLLNESGSRGLAVSAGHAYKLHLPLRVAVAVCPYLREREPCVPHYYLVVYPAVPFGHKDAYSLFPKLRDRVVRIEPRALETDKKCPAGYFYSRVRDY